MERQKTCASLRVAAIIGLALVIGVANGCAPVVAPTPTFPPVERKASPPTTAPAQPPKPVSAPTAGATTKPAAVPASTKATAQPAPTVQAAAVNPNGPEGVVKRAYDALEKGDNGAFLDALDPMPMKPPEPLRFASQLVNGFLGLSVDLNKISYRDMTYSVIFADGDWAQVAVKGYVHSLNLGIETPLDGVELARHANGKWFLSTGAYRDGLISSHLRMPIDPAIKVAIREVVADTQQKRPGWTTYRARLILRNTGSRYIRYNGRLDALLPSTGMSVSTKEGQSYPVSPLAYLQLDIQGYPVDVVIPPGTNISSIQYGRDVAAKDTVRYVLGLKYDIPTTLNPLQATIGQLGVLALSDKWSSPFPFIAGEPAGARNLPDTSDFQNKALITIDKPKIEDHYSHFVYPVSIKSKVATSDIKVAVWGSLLFENGLLVGSGLSDVSVGPLQVSEDKLDFGALDFPDGRGKLLSMKRWVFVFVDGNAVVFRDAGPVVAK